MASSTRSANRTRPVRIENVHVRRGGRIEVGTGTGAANDDRPGEPGNGPRRLEVLIKMATSAVERVNTINSRTYDVATRLLGEPNEAEGDTGTPVPSGSVGQLEGELHELHRSLSALERQVTRLEQL